MEHNHNKDDFRDSDEEKDKPYSKIKYAGGVKAEILKGLILRGMKGEKLKSLINGNIKGEKMFKRMVIAKSWLARFKLWAVRLTTLVLIWAIVMQLKALFASFGIKFAGNPFPPASK